MGRVVTNPTGSVVDASEVKILYESNENTNAYTDGDKASLDEVKDAIDMAKKVIEITFLLNNWTSNSDGTYSQTVNNSEIKSSMNPDLVSMLSSGATPEEQKTYMKNFSILCQGVGNTANGSVTYKIYKQMTGDITVGLTRLGGVKQIESGSSVDDVTVGGISVVEDKVAKIPTIPSTDNLVPYSGATKDVNIGNHSLVVATTKQESLTTRTDAYSLNANVGTGELKNPGVSIETRLNRQYVSDGSTTDEKTTVTMNPSNFTVRSRREGSSTGYTDVWVQTSIDGLKVATMDNAINITPTAIKELADPVDGRDAANKKYVDESIAAIPEVDTSNLVPYTGATKNVDLGQYRLDARNVKLVDGSAEAFMTLNGITVNGDGVNFTFRLNGTNNSFTFRSDTDLTSPVIGTPIADNQAANKKYVDDKLNSVGGGIFITTEQFHLPDIPAGESIVLSQDVSYPGKEVLGIVPYSGNKNIIVMPTFWETSTGFTKLTVRVTNIGSEAIGTGYGCDVNVTLRPTTE